MSHKLSDTAALLAATFILEASRIRLAVSRLVCGLNEKDHGLVESF